MKIVTWNCNGALRKKFSRLTELRADIYIVQECEDPSQSKDKHYQDWASNYFWKGDSKNKGVAIFAKDNIKLECLEWDSEYKNHYVKHFLPCRINNEFNLLGVWTHQNNSPNFGYIGQFWKYMEVNKAKFDNMIIAGDFNSNTIWDQWDRWWNHSDVVNNLKKQKILSVYHKFNNEEQGKELQPTFYLQRKSEKPYHIDFIFCSEPILKQVTNFEIGEFDKWIEISDHLPLLMEI
ncbi:MAG: endonuclease/exonuclease/phosphatase family protein [Flavobacteriales bacterium]|nr:endonuclease/exonuclease/phosphatase family protein [Flavobacteriales bacterium]